VRGCCRRLLKPEVIVFLLVWLGFSARFQSRAFNDPGALWHIKVGERILDDGFMTTDPFTYTFSGHMWIPQQWGGEIAMAIAHRVAGFDGVLHLYTAMLAALFAWIFSRMVRNGLHPVLAATFTAGSAVVAAFHFYARPHMATLAGMAIVMAAIIDFERGRAAPWRLWWLIPFSVLWTNIHGGVLGGVLTLGLAVAGWAAYSLLRPMIAGAKFEFATPIDRFRMLALLAGIVAACALTPFVNPFGMDMIETWKRIVGSSAMKDMVSEHQPLSLASTTGQVVVGFAAFYLIALLGTLPRWPRVSWLLPLVWFILSLKGIRQGPLFTVIGAVALADFWPHTVWHRLLLKYGDSLARPPQVEGRGWCWMILPAACVAIALNLQANRIAVPVIGHGWARLDGAAVPIELTGALRDYQKQQTDGKTLFNDANLGGFVIYHAPGLKIFMDDRFELYGDPWLRDYVEVVYETPEVFDVWTEKYGFDAALISVIPGTDRLPLEKYLSESADRWVEVARCDCAVFFRRRP